MNPEISKLWNLSDALVQLTSSLFFLGWIVGGFLLSRMADRMGRRPTTLMTTACIIASSVGQASSVNYAMFCVMRVLNGAAMGGIASSSYVLWVEFQPANKRSMLTTMQTVCWAVLVCMLSPIAYACGDNWRVFTLVTNVPLVLGLFFFRLIHESPRWLVSCGRYTDALAVLRAVAEWNGTELPDVRLASLPPASAGRVSDLFHGDLRKRTIVMGVCWFTASLVYYGLSLSAGELAGSIYVSNALMSAVELPAYAVCLFVIDRYGRKLTQIAFYLWAGVFLVLLLFITEPGAKTALALLGKFGIAGAFVLAYIYTSELFPTHVRAVAFGIMNVCSRSGGLLAPMVMSGDETRFGLLGFGVFALLSGGLTFLLPETLNADLFAEKAAPVQQMLEADEGDNASVVDDGSLSTDNESDEDAAAARPLHRV